MVVPSWTTTVVFVLIVGVVVSAFVAGVARVSGRAAAWRAAAGAAVWLALSGWMSGSGVLERQILPPPAVGFFASSLAVVLALGLSSIGRRLAAGVPIAALVAVQGFRVGFQKVRAATIPKVSRITIYQTG